jgi:hypothetical protein
VVVIYARVPSGNSLWEYAVRRGWETVQVVSDADVLMRMVRLGKVSVVLCSGLSWLGRCLPGLVQSHGEWWLRRRQRIPISLKPIDELPFFSSQFRLHPFGYPFADLGRPQLR